MGPANGGIGRSAAPAPPSRRRAAARARSQPQGIRGRPCRGCARDRGLHRGQRDLQPQEHQRVDRRVLRALRRVRAGGPARRRMGPGLHLDLLRVSLRGGGGSGPGRGRRAPARGPGMPRGLDRRHHRSGRPDTGHGRDRTPEGRDPPNVPGRALPRHARHRARQRARRSSRGHRGGGQLGGRARRLSLCPGSQRQPRDRGPALHAARHGHCHRHALPSRYLQACAPAPVG